MPEGIHHSCKHLLHSSEKFSILDNMWFAALIDGHSIFLLHHLPFVTCLTSVHIESGLCSLIVASNNRFYSPQVGRCDGPGKIRIVRFTFLIC